ncbi:hypothetical protein FF38_12566 [Lucilia cuprina]|uniref:Uncharacterized protein n=1 Tax=Lucilia cuprina TaxID=7375 RepID=A0A0L0BN44_LUCCU|nr:hypothetical protein FF38_12566 [Lucilia cuprina]
MACCTRKLPERKFCPNYKCKPLTEKFYARHDNFYIVGDNLKQYEYFANEIDKRLKYDARDRYLAPITENQTYGWLERLADKYTGLDYEILMHKIPHDEMMHIMKQVSFDINRANQIKRM